MDGRRYVAERSERDASLREVAEPEVVHAEGLTETTRACERLLGLTYDQFVNSFYAEQKQLAFLQFRTNAVRQDEVSRMLGLERLRQAEELAVQRRRDAAVRREALERNRVDPATLREDRDRAAERLRAAKEELRGGARRLKDLDEQAREASEQYRAAEAWLSLHSERQIRQGEEAGLAALVEQTRKGMAEAREEVAERERLEPDAERFRAAEADLRKRLVQRAAGQAAEAARRDLREAEAVVARLPAIPPQLDLSSIRSRLDAEETSHRLVREAFLTAQATVTARVEELRRHVERAERSAALGRCPECGQPIGEDFLRTVEERRADLDRALRDAAALLEPAESSALIEARQAASRAEEQERESAALRQARAQAEARVEALRRTVAEAPPEGVQREIEALEATVTALRQKAERFSALTGSPERLAARQREHQEAQGRLDAVRVTLRALDDQMAMLGIYDLASATMAVEEHRARLEERRRLEAERVAAAMARTLAEQDLAHAEARLTAQRDLDAEIRNLRTLEGRYDTCAKEMRQLRQDLNASIGPELAAHASENLALLTNGRYSALELDRTFAASLIEDGVRKPVLSGGEEDVVALALRLALSELIQERTGQPLSLLILDEVFGSLDVERRQSVLDRLAALRGRFEQILVVTHLEEVHQVADQVLVVRRDPERRASVVEAG